MMIYEIIHISEERICGDFLSKESSQVMEKLIKQLCKTKKKRKNLTGACKKARSVLEALFIALLANLKDLLRLIIILCFFSRWLP